MKLIQFLALAVPTVAQFSPPGAFLCEPNTVGGCCKRVVNEGVFGLLGLNCINGTTRTIVPQPFLTQDSEWVCPSTLTAACCAATIFIEKVKRQETSFPPNPWGCESTTNPAATVTTTTTTSTSTSTSSSSSSTNTFSTIIID